MVGKKIKKKIEIEIKIAVADCASGTISNEIWEFKNIPIKIWIKSYNTYVSVAEESD